MFNNFRKLVDSINEKKKKKKKSKRRTGDDKYWGFLHPWGYGYVGRYYDNNDNNDGVEGGGDGAGE